MICFTRSRRYSDGHKILYGLLFRYRILLRNTVIFLSLIYVIDSINFTYKGISMGLICT